ncbi:glycosyltransferase [Leptothermofonsia sp. ETS-13]|uniref:glycosyltransferase n=1 Tax=Leptothermofonsia sp. ETS-13 TaxID=3035696 RepID=UPI003BA35C5F
MATACIGAPTMHILMMPDYRIDNPYQTLLAKALEAEGVHIQFPVGYRRVFPIFRAVKSSPVPIDVLHLHWLNPYLKGKNWLVRLIYTLKFLLDVLITKLSGVRVVWTVHNARSHEALFPALELWAQQALARLSDRLIVHHNAAVDEIVPMYRFSPAKVSVIPHGHYRNNYGPAVDPQFAREILELPTTGRIYLNLGMLRPYKGVENLLNLWQTHADLVAGHTLLIAGKPLDEAYKQRLTEQASQTQGVLLRAVFVEDSQIPLYFSAADVVVLPFERILTSGSLLLAMSYGKPIIAPRTNGIAETLGKADKLLYEPTDEQGLLHAFKRSMQTDLNELSELVNKECDRLDWTAIAHKTHQLYQDILTPGGGAS